MELLHKKWNCSTKSGTVPLCVGLLGYCRNLFVFRLEEENNENTGKVVDAVMESIEETPQHDFVRIGFQQPTSDSDQSCTRPIKV